MERTITVTETGIINVRTFDEETHYNHRYCLVPNDNLTGQPEDVVTAATEAWTPEVIAAWNLAHPPPTAEELAQQALVKARQQAKMQSFIDNLPSRAAVKNAIDAAFPDTKQNRIVTRLADVIYWMVWDKED